MNTECSTAFAYESKLGSIRGTNVNVRQGPGTNYAKVASLTIGSQVIVIDETAGTDGQVWYQVQYNNGTASGYILSTYVSTASSYAGLSDSEFEMMLASQQFPESYKPYLRSLHQEYPNWTFKAVHTGLDWNTALNEECTVGRNLVHKDNVSSWKSTEDGAFDWANNYWPGFDGASWQAASKEIIAYYMDPRNFLDSTYVFQFLDQKYLPTVQLASGVELMVKGTFMESNYTGVLDGNEASGVSSSVSVSSNAPSSSGTVQLIGPGESVSAQTQNTVVSDTSSNGPSAGSTTGPGGGTAGPGGGTGVGNATYVDMIMYAAKQSGVNPYVLTSMIIQEQGQRGTSPLISGTYSSYPGIYNFYNVEAYASGSMSATDRGLWWASQSGTYGRPWNSRQAAIVGGAIFYGEGYTNKTQNTFYLKKFNVASSTNRYKHQYMTNIQAAASEGYHLAQAYSAEIRTAAHDFEIPVYLNMPDVTNKPSVDGNPNNKLANLYVDGFALTPTFNMNTATYDLIVDPSVSAVNVVANAIASTSAVSGTGQVNLQSGINQIQVCVTAQNGSIRNYIINIIRQSGGQTGGASHGTAPNQGSTQGPGNGSGPGGGSTTVSTNVQQPTDNNIPKSDTTVILVGPGGQ